MDSEKEEVGTQDLIFMIRELGKRTSKKRNRNSNLFRLPKNRVRKKIHGKA